jgi:hypothetical protein
VERDRLKDDEARESRPPACEHRIGLIGMRPDGHGITGSEGPAPRSSASVSGSVARHRDRESRRIVVTFASNWDTPAVTSTSTFGSTERRRRRGNAPCHDGYDCHGPRRALIRANPLSERGIAGKIVDAHPP